MIPALSVRAVSKRFRASGFGRWTYLTVLQNVSLAVAAGEVVAIAGPRNCGKSTLLRCAAGLARPDAGDVTWFGAQAHLVAGRRPAALVGEMPRGPSAFSVEDSLRYHATMNGAAPMPRVGTLVEHLDRVGLGALRRAAVSRLTPSALRRLAIAEALSSGARILLLDETCSGLAPPAMALCGELLQQLASSGAAIVVASRERTVLATMEIRRFTLFGGSLWGGDRSTAGWTSLKTGENMRPGKFS